MSASKQRSLLIIAGVLVVAIAVLAGANLWFLKQLHGRSLHDTAARSVLGLGSEVARNLAHHPAVQSGPDDSRRWGDFSLLIQALKRVEPSLQYVTVNEGNVTVFHEDLSLVQTTPPKEGTALDVRLGRKLLATAGGVVPVITFSAPAPTGAGVMRAVQIALRKEAVQQREEPAVQMLAMMFRLSLITLTVALGLAGVLGVWMVRHELDRQRRHRDEEHLAFAGLLADGIIHDVRNPMSSLRLDLQMLEKEAAKAQEGRLDRIRELALRARATMDRMDLVMREFLYVSKPDARQPERFEVNACLTDCLDLLAPRFERAGIQLISTLCNESLMMTGYSVGLKRAILNVLTNAQQASSSGKRVMLALERKGHEAVIRVEDEGPGLGKEGAARLFERFVSGRPGGLGLGLYLAKAAVENNKGSIHAENRNEGGARFTLILPLTAVQPASPERQHDHEHHS